MRDQTPETALKKIKKNPPNSKIDKFGGVGGGESRNETRGSRSVTYEFAKTAINRQAELKCEVWRCTPACNYRETNTLCHPCGRKRPYAMPGIHLVAEINTLVIYTLMQRVFAQTLVMPLKISKCIQRVVQRKMTRSGWKKDTQEKWRRQEVMGTNCTEGRLD